MRVVLLPGMDGSGQLHDGFVTAMAPRFRVEVVAYPPTGSWTTASCRRSSPTACRVTHRS